MRYSKCFKLKTGRFLVDSITLTMQETGLYIKLLCLQFQNGRLSEQEILHACNIGSLDEIPYLMNCFSKDANGKYYNDMLDSQHVKLKKRIKTVPFPSSHLGSRIKAKSKGIDYEKWIEMVTFFGNKCLSCGMSFYNGEYPTIDHVIPRSCGGCNDISNLQPLCRRCNSSKRNRRSTDYRLLYLETIPDHLKKLWFPER